MVGSQPNAVGSNPGPFGGGGKVRSVFGRTGDIVAEFGDYLASLIENDSGVAGNSVADALDTLAALISGLDSTDIANVSSVIGATVTDALNTLRIETGSLRRFSLEFGADLTIAGNYAVANGIATTPQTAALSALSQFRVARAARLVAIAWRKTNNPGGGQLAVLRNGLVVTTVALGAGAGSVNTLGTPIAYAVGDTISLEYDSGNAPGQSNFSCVFESVPL